MSNVHDIKAMLRVRVSGAVCPCPSAEAMPGVHVEVVHPLGCWCLADETAETLAIRLQEALAFVRGRGAR